MGKAWEESERKGKKESNEECYVLKAVRQKSVHAFVSLDH